MAWDQYDRSDLVAAILHLQLHPGYIGSEIAQGKGSKPIL